MMSYNILDHIKTIKSDVNTTLADNNDLKSINEMFEQIENLINENKYDYSVIEKYNVAVSEITPLKQVKTLYKKNFDNLGEAELQLLGKSIKWINYICEGAIKLAVCEKKVFFAQFHEESNTMVLLLFVLE